MSNGELGDHWRNPNSSNDYSLGSHSREGHSRYCNFEILNRKKHLYLKSPYNSTKKRKKMACQNIALNCATSLLFLLIKYTGKDQQSHSAPEKTIHPHIPWLQGYSHKHRVMKSSLQTPAATLR